MEGVEILNSTRDVSIAVFIGFLIVFLVVTILATWAFDDLLMGCFVGFVVGVFAGCICNDMFISDNHYYDVTISEDVKFSEFTEKYEIIDQEGKIFTVTLKEEE